MEKHNEELWRIAKKRSGFKKSLSIYFIVNSFLCAIWYITSGKNGSYFWPVWPILGWGVGIAFQYADAYLKTDLFSAEKEYEKLKAGKPTLNAGNTARKTKTTFTMEEPLPQASDQLRLIDAMINKAKNRFSENGYSYLIWGWTILFCSVGNYLLHYVIKTNYHWTIWLITWIVLPVQLLYVRQRRRKAIVRTYTDDLVKYVWLAFLIVLILAMIIIPALSGSFKSVYAVLLILYGVPTFLSGAILKFKPLIAGGCCCWLLSILSLFIPAESHVLLLGAAVIIAWIIPGCLLNIQYKKQHAFSSFKSAPSMA